MGVRSGVQKPGDGSTANSTSRTLAIDASWQAGDVIHLELHWSNNSALGALPGAPGDWTQIGATLVQSTAQSRAKLWHRLTQAEIDGATTWVFTIGTTARFVGFALALFGLVAAGDPVDTNDQAVNSAGTTLTAPDVVTTAAETILVAGWGCRWTGTGGSNLITHPSGTHTSLGEVATNFASSTVQCSIEVGYKTIDPTVAGTYGPYDATMLIGATPLGTHTAYAKAAGGVTGDLNGTMPAVVGSLDGGVLVRGDLAGTVPAVTGALDGDVIVTGALAGTTPGVTGALAGEVTVTGALAGTAPAVTGQLSGLATVGGNLVATVPAVVGQLTGTSDAEPPPVTLEDVMRYAALNHYVIVTGLAEAIRVNLGEALGGEPDRVCHVVPGEIAWDQCDCGQLALTTSRLYPSDTFPTTAADSPKISNCTLPYVVADVTVSLVRCVPGVDEDGVAPACDELAAATLIMYDDGERVWRETICYLQGLADQLKIADFSLGELTYVGPQGQCAGVQLPVKIGFTAVCCGG